MSLRNKQNTTYYDQLVTTSQPLTGIVASRWVIFRMTVSITTRIEWWFGRWRLNLRRIRRNRTNNSRDSGQVLVRRNRKLAHSSPFGYKKDSPRRVLQ